MTHFLNTMGQIVRSDSVGTLTGVARHLRWQVRRALNGFPCDLSLGKSRLLVSRPCGVAALVNAMGEYDYNNMGFLRMLLADGGTFVDVGANIGSYTLVASENPRARVVSIEPHPKTFALLEKNIAHNERHNVECWNIALSSRDGQLVLTDDSESELNRVVPNGEPRGQRLMVPSRRFDELFKDLGTKPDFVKIDVEGHELEVLQGMGKLAASVRVIFVEGGERLEVQRWMRSADFSGPWFPRFERRVFSEKPQPRPEDPVYILKSIADDLIRGFSSYV